MTQKNGAKRIHQKCFTHLEHSLDKLIFKGSKSDLMEGPFEAFEDAFRSFMAALHPECLRVGALHPGGVPANQVMALAEVEKSSPAV